MTVYKKKDKYYCRFQIDGERHHYLCTGATTEKEAKKIEAQFMYKVQQQQNGIIPKAKKSITLNQLLSLYLNYANINNKDYARSNYKIKIINDYFGVRKLANLIKKSNIEDFRIYLRDVKKLSSATINRYICVISKAYNLAIYDELLEVNPCKGISKLKENNNILRYLTIEEENNLFKVMPNYLRQIVTCALQTGLRKSNVLNLRWEQIDLDLGFIEIEKQENKGHKQLRIPISEKLLSVFKEIGIKENGYVFVNPKTNAPYNTIRKAWISSLEKANIKNMRFHDLRHTVGTRLNEKGVDIKTIQEILGHSSITTTQIYTHSSFTRKKSAIECLNSYN